MSDCFRVGNTTRHLCHTAQSLSILREEDPLLVQFSSPFGRVKELTFLNRFLEEGGSKGTLADDTINKVQCCQAGQHSHSHVRPLEGGLG